MEPQFHRRHPLVDATLVLIALVLGSLALYQDYYKPPVASISGPSVLRARQGETVTLPIFIDTAGQTINAAEVYLEFDPAKFEVTSISKDGSFFTIWIKDEPAYSNDDGKISFAGGLPYPGFKGRGQVGTVTIKPKVAPLSTQLVFTTRTQVLLNDGLGTKVPLRMAAIPVEVTK